MRVATPETPENTVAIAAGDGINNEIVQFDEEHRSIVLCAIAGIFLHMPSYAS